jgi:hypothetical protein
VCLPLLTPEPYQVVMQAIVTECTNAFPSTIISAPASYSDPDLLCGVDWIFHTSTNDIFPYITPINDVAPISASLPARAIVPTSGGHHPHLINQYSDRANTLMLRFLSRRETYINRITEVDLRTGDRWNGMRCQYGSTLFPHLATTRVSLNTLSILTYLLSLPLPKPVS